MIEVLVPLELEEPKMFEHVPHDYLKEGPALEIARALKTVFTNYWGLTSKKMRKFMSA